MAKVIRPISMRMKRKVSLHPLKRFFKWEGLILLSAITVFGCRKPINERIDMRNKAQITKNETSPDAGKHFLDVVPVPTQRDKFPDGTKIIKKEGGGFYFELPKRKTIVPSHIH